MRQPVFFRYDPSRENAFGALRGAHLKSSNLPIKNPPGEHRRGDFFQDLLRLAANIGQNAAIGVEDLAVHEVGCVAGKEHTGANHVLRVTPAACGGLGNDEAVKGMTAAVRLTLTQGRGLGGGIFSAPLAAA